MTEHSIKRLKKAINTMVAISDEKKAFNYKTNQEFKFRLNFITLTLPSAQGLTTDQEIKKKAFDPFIKRCKRKYGLKSYVWKAERQKNGNLHFHLTGDVFIHYEDLRNDWNACINKLGFVDRFYERHGHHHPNSTDVHAIKNVKDLTMYLVKYMTKKNSGVVPIGGKMWDCSENLKQKIRCEMAIDSEQEYFIERITNALPDNIRTKDFCSFIYLNTEQHEHWIQGYPRQLYEEWKKRVIEFERQPRKRIPTEAPPRKITPIHPSLLQEEICFGFVKLKR